MAACRWLGHRYCLRRIEAETGRSLNNPGDVAELVTAIHAWCQLPHQILHAVARTVRHGPPRSATLETRGDVGRE